MKKIDVSTVGALALAFCTTHADSSFEFENTTFQPVRIYLGTFERAKTAGAPQDAYVFRRQHAEEVGSKSTKKFTVKGSPEGMEIHKLPNPNRVFDRISFSKSSIPTASCSGAKCEYAAPQLMGKKRFTIATSNRLTKENFVVKALD